MINNYFIDTSTSIRTTIKIINVSSILWNINISSIGGITTTKNICNDIIIATNWNISCCSWYFIATTIKISYMSFRNIYISCGNITSFIVTTKNIITITTSNRDIGGGNITTNIRTTIKIIANWCFLINIGCGNTWFITTTKSITNSTTF